LILTAIRLGCVRRKKQGGDPERNPAIRLMGGWANLGPSSDERSFLVRLRGRWVPTRLFLVLVAVELTDVLFAFDSVPAVLAITPSAAIAFASNLFAVAGLRSLYFALSSMRTRLRHLETALVIILLFIGTKTLVSPWFVVGTGASLLVVGAVLAVAVLGSRPAPRA
jgi:tellurite resistance protein TerC